MEDTLNTSLSQKSGTHKLHLYFILVRIDISWSILNFVLVGIFHLIEGETQEADKLISKVGVRSKKKVNPKTKSNDKSKQAAIQYYFWLWSRLFRCGWTSKNWERGVGQGGTEQTICNVGIVQLGYKYLVGVPILVLVWSIPMPTRPLPVLDPIHFAPSQNTCSYSCLSVWQQRRQTSTLLVYSSWLSSNPILCS